jgi:glycine/D-amino acid oxidase-like deaminating enzyme
MRGSPVVLRNGEVSFWHAALGGPPPPRPALPGSRDADVCIVGAGYTGLWTAYYLKRADPALDIVVLDAAFAGFGASGRNGGWLSASLAAPRERLAREAGGREPVIALQRAMREAVDEVARTLQEEGIDADLVKGGLLRVARSPAQLARLRAELADERDWGAGEEDLRWLEPAEAADRIRVAGTLGAAYSPHCARVQPAKLVRGLAAAVERLGVTIHEATRVHRIEPGAAHTLFGTVRARQVLRATEGFTAGLPGQKRTWLPMNSSMIVTAPLPDAAWEEIGWSGCETLGDQAHVYVYAQRTADGRIAIGGRGVPYRFGSRTDERGETAPATVRELSRHVTDLFPALNPDVAIEHTWSGVLGVPRDWCASVALDERTGLGHAGGYVGHGVTTASLAGRTLAELVRGEDTQRTRLPWINRRVRGWEPEPVRWLAVRGVYSLYRLADRAENRGRPRTHVLARLADRIAGR